MSEYSVRRIQLERDELSIIYPLFSRFCPRHITVCLAGVLLMGSLVVHRVVGVNAASARDEVSISFGETGCTGTGGTAQEVFITNANSGRSIKATIEVTTYSGTQQDKSQRVETVRAGGKVKLGCTRTVTGNSGSYEIAYRIVGAEYA